MRTVSAVAQSEAERECGNFEIFLNNPLFINLYTQFEFPPRVYLLFKYTLVCCEIYAWAVGFRHFDCSTAAWLSAIVRDNPPNTLNL